jgi:hypothetical protein
MRQLTSRLFLAALGALAFSGACGSDDAAPVTPVNYVPHIRQLDGSELGDSVGLLCDGTLAVSVQILRKHFDDEADEADQPVEVENAFVLRPANACGSASRCGYIRLEAFDGDGNLLATTDTATTAGVLTFDPATLPTDPVELHATLIHGYDQTKFVNPDSEIATTESSVTLTPTAEPCVDDGAGGAGGAPNQPVGGAGGEPTAGGAGGAAGGAGGESLGGAPALPLGGAGAGGA